MLVKNCDIFIRCKLKLVAMFGVTGDKVMIRDGKTSQVVCRSADERASNPERLNLDRYSGIE